MQTSKTRQSVIFSIFFFSSSLFFFPLLFFEETETEPVPLFLPIPKERKTLHNRTAEKKKKGEEGRKDSGKPEK